MKKFKRFGFRRNTHDESGKFKRKDANIWQVHVWNRSIAGFVGHQLSSKDPHTFEYILESCQKNWTEENDLDEEDVALALINLIECGLVVVEETAEYSTDLYDDGIKFWK